MKGNLRCKIPISFFSFHTLAIHASSFPHFSLSTAAPPRVQLDMYTYIHIYALSGFATDCYRYREAKLSELRPEQVVEDGG